MSASTERPSGSAPPRNSLILVSYNFPPAVGGIEQLCVELARALHALGVEVHVLTKPQPSAAAFDAREPYRVHRFRGADVGLCVELAALLRAGHTRVLCLQWTSALWLAAARVVFGVPRVLGVMVMGKEIYPSPRSPFPEGLQLAALRRVIGAASHVLPISHFTEARLQARAPHPHVQTVTLGVDASRFPAPDAAAVERFRAGRPGPIVLSVARLVPRKGMDTLLRALPALLQQHPKLHCLLAGDGPDAERLHGIARKLDVESHVTFLGRVSDVDLPALYAACDVFALLSRADAGGSDIEGFGLVLLEAQAAGCAVVTTNEGGMPDAMQPDVTGVLVDAHDPDDAARRTGALLADAARLQAMRVAAVQYARTQTWQATAQRVLATLEQDP